MRTATFTLTLLCLIPLTSAQEPENAPTDPHQVSHAVLPNHLEMVGQSVPDVTFAGTDGKEISIGSYRGKPLLIDLWATWCAPCLAGLPSLNHIYEEFRNKGLQFISFDQEAEGGNNRDAKAATKYLAQHHYAWKNFHDADRNVATALQCDGLPLVLLIDANGRIVYYDFGGHAEEGALRRAIAGLGPDVAPPAASENDKPDESQVLPDRH